MGEAITGEAILRQKYGLQKSPEVAAAAERTTRKTGQVLPSKSAEDADVRIRNYLDRLGAIINPEDSGVHPDFDVKERNLAMLKRALHSQFVIKPDAIPESYFNSLRQRHLDEGYGYIEIPEEYRRELSETIVTDQEKSLDKWVDYLTSDEAAKYPDWLKYMAFRSILRMGRYDKERGAFTERTGGAVSPFPDLNPEALAIVLDAFEKFSRGEKPNFGYDITDDLKNRFLTLLGQKNFAKLYAMAIGEFRPITDDLLKTTVGEWKRYPKGSDHMQVVKSISDYGTGWCLRGPSMAERYLKDNDLIIYYSNDGDGRPTVPRVTIVINSRNKIAEVRGVAYEENLDPYIDQVVDDMLAQHPDGQNFRKKSHDMKEVTRMTKKVKDQLPLTRDELIFLYEIEAPIEGFGVKKDPRIAELRKVRNPDEDMPLVLGCDTSQIARDISQVNSRTKAYVGELVPGIFELIQRHNVEYVYTKFPEDRIHRTAIKIGGKNLAQLEQELAARDVELSEFVKKFFKNNSISPDEAEEAVDFSKLKLRDLGFSEVQTLDAIYKRIEELGLRLCPQETAIQYCLQVDHPQGEWFDVGIQPVVAANGDTSIFRVGRNNHGVWLRGNWLEYPGNVFGPDDEFMFRLPPIASEQKQPWWRGLARFRPPKIKNKDNQLV